MRLLNEHREAFVNAVMASLPWKHPMSNIKFSEQVEQLAMDALPSEVRALSKKYPGMLSIREISFKYEHAGWTGWAYIGRPDMVDLSKLNLKALIKARFENEEESLQRNQTRAKLMAIASSCTTLSALKLALPDLVSYMPEDVKSSRSTALVDPTLIRGLKKSGLPIPKGAAA